jgi:hypothetical protein
MKALPSKIGKLWLPSQVCRVVGGGWPWAIAWLYCPSNKPLPSLLLNQRNTERSIQVNSLPENFKSRFNMSAAFKVK